MQHFSCSQGWEPLSLLYPYTTATGGVHTGCGKSPSRVELVALQCPRNGTEIVQIKNMVKTYFVYRCVEVGASANSSVVEVNYFNYTIAMNAQHVETWPVLVHFLWHKCTEHRLPERKIRNTCLRQELICIIVQYLGQRSFKMYYASLSGSENVEAKPCLPHKA